MHRERRGKPNGGTAHQIVERTGKKIDAIPGWGDLHDYPYLEHGGEDLPDGAQEEPGECSASLVDKGKKKDRDGDVPARSGTARRACAGLALDRWTQAVAKTRSRIRGRRSLSARSPAGCSGRRSARPRWR